MVDLRKDPWFRQLQEFHEREDWERRVSRFKTQIGAVLVGAVLYPFVEKVVFGEGDWTRSLTLLGYIAVASAVTFGLSWFGVVRRIKALPSSIEFQGVVCFHADGPDQIDAAIPFDPTEVDTDSPDAKVTLLPPNYVRVTRSASVNAKELTVHWWARRRCR